MNPTGLVLVDRTEGSESFRNAFQAPQLVPILEHHPDIFWVLLCHIPMSAWTQTHISNLSPPRALVVGKGEALPHVGVSVNGISEVVLSCPHSPLSFLHEQKEGRGQ